MTRRLPPAVVVGVAALVLLLGLLVGVKMVSAPFGSADAAAPTCSPEQVAKGEKVTPNLITVDVYNASERSGLANRVSINLQRRGFLAGKVGNSDSSVRPRGVAILAQDDRDPRVRLVASQFDSLQFEKPDIDAGGGVVVIIGDDYRDLRRDGAAREVESDRALTVCTPKVAVEDVQ